MKFSWSLFYRIKRSNGNRLNLLLILTLCFFIAGSSKVFSQNTERWKLVKTEYPVLPQAILDVNEGRNAGSFIKIRRTENKNEVVYINKSVVRGVTECHWNSGFIWNLKLPEIISTGVEYSIDTEARFDKHQGQGCGMGRISISYGSKSEPLRDRAPNVVRIKGGLADPDPGGIANPIATEILRVDARPGLPENNMFTIAVHISDGGLTDQVVALYVYEKLR